MRHFVFNNRKRILLTAVVCFLVFLLLLIWWQPRADDPVTIHFVGTNIDNLGGRTFVLFAITNRYATNIRGSAFQLLESTNGYVEASPPLRYPTAPGRRDVWLSAAGTAGDGTIIGVIPPSTGAWATVFEQLQFGARKIPWRNRVAVYLFQNGFPRLARRFHPSKGGNRDWVKDPNVVFGPKMQGTQPD